MVFKKKKKKTQQTKESNKQKTRNCVEFNLFQKIQNGKIQIKCWTLFWSSPREGKGEFLKDSIWNLKVFGIY